MLAQCGFGSLRGLEELIIAGRITVNRQPAEVGQKIGPEDQIRINGELVKLRFAPPRARVLLYHKPAGEIVTRADPEGRASVFDKLPRINGAKWIAIGRLDYNSEGLLLFTTSGELANRMMHPRYQVEREYAVRVMGTLTPEQLRALTEGVTLEDGVAKAISVVEGGGDGANHWYTIVLPEGRNREVRRMFEALGLMVSRLIRTRYGVVNMPSQLKRGQTLELVKEQLNMVLKASAMPLVDASAEGRPQGAHGPREGNKGSRERVAPRDIDGNRAPPPGAAPRPRGNPGAPREVDGNRPHVSTQGQGQARKRAGPGQRNVPYDDRRERVVDRRESPEPRVPRMPVVVHRRSRSGGRGPTGDA